MRLWSRFTLKCISNGMPGVFLLYFVECIIGQYWCVCVFTPDAEFKLWSIHELTPAYCCFAIWMYKNRCFFSRESYLTTFAFDGSQRSKCNGKEQGSKWMVYGHILDSTKSQMATDKKPGHQSYTCENIFEMHNNKPEKPEARMIRWPLYTDKHILHQ